MPKLVNLFLNHNLLSKLLFAWMGLAGLSIFLVSDRSDYAMALVGTWSILTLTVIPTFFALWLIFHPDSLHNLTLQRFVKSGPASPTPPPTTQPPAPPKLHTSPTVAPPTQSPRRPVQLTAENILRRLEISSAGMVGLNALLINLSHELERFFKPDNSTSRLILLWGDPATGKTELGQRLAGLRKDFPKFVIENRSAVYHTGFADRLNMKSIVDSAPDRSVVIVDEVDKFFDERANMLSPAETKQLRHSFLTYCEAKPLFWILTGSFVDRRGSGSLTQKSISEALGPELGTRVDFADWKMPSWTVSTLLQAAAAASRRRGVSYTDEALTRVVQYCLEHQGGPRLFEKIESSLIRRESQNSGESRNRGQFSVQQVEKLLAQMQGDV